MTRRRNKGGTVRNYCVDCGAVFRTSLFSTRTRCAKCEATYNARMKPLTTYRKRHKMPHRQPSDPYVANLKYDPVLQGR